MKEKFNNELEKIIYTYFDSDNNQINIEEDDTISERTLKSELFQNLFLNAVSFERPDMYSIVGDEIVIIEHFEFDSSNRIIKNGKDKGSKLRLKEYELDKKFDKMINNNSTETIKLTTPIDQSGNCEDYKKNLLLNFKNHYSKIEGYKNNIREIEEEFDRDKIKVAFFIEDITLLGNFEYNNKYWTKLINPLKKKFFLDVLKQSKYLDYIFYAQCGVFPYSIWFMDMKAIQLYLEKYGKEELNNLSFQKFDNPISSSFCIKLPKNNYEES